MKVALDTNILIDNPDVVFDSSREFVIPFTVIRELDNLKRNRDLKRAAQQSIKNIWSQYSDGKIEILGIPKTLGESPDEYIIQATKDAGAAILSDDIAVRLIAKAFDVQVSNFEAEDQYDTKYTGHVTIQGNLQYEQDYVQVKEMQIEEFETQFSVRLKENQYCVINRVIDKNDIWYNSNGKVTRISQSMQPVRAAGVNVTPLDSLQMAAIHAVMNDTPLTVLTGPLGSGKSLIALIGALAGTVGQKKHRKYEKIYVTRPPIAINDSVKLGYLKGDLSDKFLPWLGGIQSNLQFLLETTEKDKELKVAESTFTEFFELLPLESLQGQSIHNSIILVDEFQLLDTDMLKLVLSRVSKGSKIVLIGDHIGQTYHVNRANEGFKTLFKHLGAHEELSYVHLENIYRSALAKFVAQIFEGK